jgi:hypothetical protein
VSAANPTVGGAMPPTVLDRTPRGHFRVAFMGRLSEWAFASMLLLWGVVLVLPQDTFDGRAFVAFRTLWDETMPWALLAAGGVLRLGVLSLNGLWRPLYYLRAWIALSSTVIWAAIAFGFASSGAFGTWVAIYPVLTLFEAMNVIRAMSYAAAEIAARAPRAPA